MKRLLIGLLVYAPLLLAATVYTSDFETGFTAPTTVTNMAISTEQACSGTQSYEGTAINGVLRDSTLASVDGYMAFQVYLTEYPASVSSFAILENSAGTDICYLQLDTDGTMNLLANSGTTQNPADVLSLNTWYHIQLAGDGRNGTDLDTCTAYVNTVQIAQITDANWTANLEHAVLFQTADASPNGIYWDDWTVDDATLPSAAACGASDNKYKSVVIGD